MNFLAQKQQLVGVIPPLPVYGKIRQLSNHSHAFVTDLNILV